MSIDGRWKMDRNSLQDNVLGKNSPAGDFVLDKGEKRERQWQGSARIPASMPPVAGIVPRSICLFDACGRLPTEAGGRKHRRLPSPIRNGTMATGRQIGKVPDSENCQFVWNSHFVPHIGRFSSIWQRK
jgi:hypothetical protein